LSRGFDRYETNGGNNGDRSGNKDEAKVYKNTLDHAEQAASFAPEQEDCNRS